MEKIWPFLHSLSLWGGEAGETQSAPGRNLKPPLPRSLFSCFPPGHRCLSSCFPPGSCDLRAPHPYVEHLLPAAGAARKQGVGPGQAGVVDADVHAAVLRADRREHGEDVLLVRQVTSVGDQSPGVACTLTFGSQLL